MRSSPKVRAPHRSFSGAIRSRDCHSLPQFGSTQPNWGISTTARDRSRRLGWNRQDAKSARNITPTIRTCTCGCMSFVSYFVAPFCSRGIITFNVPKLRQGIRRVVLSRSLPPQDLGGLGALAVFPCISRYIPFSLDGALRGLPSRPTSRSSAN